MTSGNITLQVAPNVLIDTAQSVRSLAHMLQQDFQIIMQLAAKTQSYWLGDAGNKKREEFLEQQDNVSDILTRFDKYPQDLLEMANLYAAAESKILNQNTALPSDFLT